VCLHWRNSSNHSQPWEKRLFFLIVCPHWEIPKHARFLAPPCWQADCWKLLKPKIGQQCLDVEQLANQGNALAQYELGRRHSLGEGMPQNHAEAVRLFRLAADQGMADAQLNLGTCYAKGTGVEQNLEEAVRLYRLAADQGLAEAQFYLGKRYANGTGVEQNQAEAVRLYHLAAIQGHALAKKALATAANS
jgi:TPR repeat protein